MKNPSILEQLKEYFKNTPREEIEKNWKAFEEYNTIGPTIDNFLEQIKQTT